MGVQPNTWLKVAKGAVAGPARGEWATLLYLVLDVVVYLVLDVVVSDTPVCFPVQRNKPVEAPTNYPGQSFDPDKEKPQQDMGERICIVNAPLNQPLS